MKRPTDLPASEACNGPCDCGPADGAIPRRELLKLTGALAAGALVGSPLRAAPAPPTLPDFEKLVPAEKNLPPQWVRSLFERGEPEWFSGDQLRYIGLPIGGICCGQVYLGGDGRLWHWDIFNQFIRTGSAHYAHPMEVQSPVEIDFAIHIETEDGARQRTLDKQGFPGVRFRGAYPFGFVEYAAADCPVSVSLEAFSPFVPLDVDNSSLPLTVMRYTVRNTSAKRVSCRLTGRLTNPVLLYSGRGAEAELVNRIVRGRGATCLHCTAAPSTQPTSDTVRPDVLFDDFESETYENWSVEGTAFGSGPVVAARMPAYQGNVGAHGKRLVNSHNTRQGEDVREGDAHVGVMTSREFTIERHYINFLIGGGAHKGQTCLNLLVDGKVVASATGRNENRLRPGSFDVRRWEGRKARLQIVDQARGGWGNIGVDHIVFSDQPAAPGPPVDQRADWGQMTLAVLDDSAEVIAAAAEPGEGQPSEGDNPQTARAALGRRPRGMVGKRLILQPGETKTVVFAVAWRFPNYELPPVGKGHYYAERFASSLEAVEYLAANFETLYRRTKAWHDCWYDSTLPYWLLDRTFVNTSILATATCLRFAGGRFWGWEGVRCCPGTCSHVWQYAQAVGRVFPLLERITREKVDFGLAFHEDGSIDYRAEFHRRVAVDGQCGTILRVLREHQMSPDEGFLRRVWPRVRRSIEYLIGQDGDDNGVLEGAQYNTLDAEWFGPISWISSMYLAALRAGAAMAREMGDETFARRCDTLAERGARWLVEHLFNGEYFYQQRDPAHPEAFGAGIGCHIDQVLGQAWAHQVGLPRVLPQEETVTALKSLWRYNFAPDVGPYRKRYPAGRWYAMPGEAGLIMCTFPKGGEREARGGRPAHTFAGYLNECMNGFEYMAAAHMIAEGLVQEGLAVSRAIHDRYHPSKRNPYNEIECGDHYARSMASYGVYVSVCGFEYHGPRGHIGFAPKLTPERFRAAFIGAEGWGTFEQQVEQGCQRAAVRMVCGRLRVRSVSLGLHLTGEPQSVKVLLDGRPLPAGLRMKDDKALIALEETATVGEHSALEIELS